jgi:opacity protein-like surface antigen
MKHVSSFKHIILAAAAALGLATTAFAQARNVAVPNPAEARPTGLLGKEYLGLSYGFVDFDGIAVDGHQYSIEFNQGLREGLDAFLGYNHTRTDRIGPSRLKGHDVFLGVRPFMHYQGVKPFVEIGAGWTWVRGFGMDDDSFAWGAGVGAEIELVSSLTLTPFVRYTDAIDFAGSGTWNYGAEANYWFTPRFALKGGVALDDDQNTVWNVGVNFRF